MMAPMKTKGTLLLLTFCLLLAALVAAPQARGANNQEISVGIRDHGKISGFSEYPFKRNDLSYALAYGYEEESGMWQFVVDYAPKPRASGTADFAITPGLNLVFKDRFYRGGLGVMKTYVKDDMAKDNWTKFYWQWMFGVDIPIGSWFSIDAYAYYPFTDWSKFFNKFDYNAFELGVWFAFHF